MTTAKPNHLVVSLQDTGIPQFPGTTQQSTQAWSDYLNARLQEGWVLSQVLTVKVGRSDVKHLCFVKTTQKGTIKVVDLNSSIPNFTGTVKASRANLEDFLNSQSGLILAFTTYSFGVETRTLSIFLEKG